MIRFTGERLLPIALSMVLLYTVFGYYAVVEINRSVIRKEVSSLLRGNSFTITPVTVSDLSRDPDFRRINSREIEYRGKVYDVVKEVRKGNSIIFYCFHDTKEEKLMAGLKKAGNSKLAQILVEQLSFNAIHPASSVQGIQNFTELTFVDPRSSPVARPPDPSTPPPECLFPSGC